MLKYGLNIGILVKKRKFDTNTMISIRYPASNLRTSKKVVQEFRRIDLSACKIE
jgi:hypothetical protein